MKSEVRQLLEQIELEMEAAHAGLEGLASGTARHEIITARVQGIANRYTGQLQALHDQLHQEEKDSASS